MKIRTNKRTGCTIEVITCERFNTFTLWSPNTGTDVIRESLLTNPRYKSGDKLPERVAEHWKGFLANQK